MPPRTRKPTAGTLDPQPDARAPLDVPRFLATARPVLRLLAEDLLVRADGSRALTRGLHARHDAEQRAHRTADAYDVWRRAWVEQVAAAWMLSAVFVRTLEDRGLVRRARLAGPGALDSQAQFQAIAPFLTERDYLVTVFREAAGFEATAALFDARLSPIGKLAPSAQAAKALLAVLREPSPDAPAFRFGQPDTRFLGDLYQDLNEQVRERFALLQTPRFVEEYILDRTLERVVAERGVDAVDILDPTCGSGHFLLGAFDRLVGHHLRARPAEGARAAAGRSLAAMAGVDLNPYAVAIARMRLTLAFLEKAGIASLDQAPALPWNLVVADSLLHGTRQTTLAEAPGQSTTAWLGDRFALEDAEVAKRVLGRRYSVVVGNPPYISVKDAALRETYRAMYASAAGKYSLGAPFLERFFELANEGGRVGTITANSFMKREFGKKLIEQVLPRWQLDAVVNTSGAFIPGHGTPTVILFGRNLPPQGTDVHTVLAKRGEPSTPENPSKGKVWSSLRDRGDEVGYDDEFITVAKLARATLDKHPWSLGGGGAAELKELLEDRGTARIADAASSVGISCVTGEDDVYLLPPAAIRRSPLAPTRGMITGEVLRDWFGESALTCVFPYDDELHLMPLDTVKSIARYLWSFKSILQRRKRFGVPMIERGLSWYELQELYSDKLRTPLSISFAFVATHNHFVLDRGSKVFNRSAPIIKLKEGATEDEHLALLAYLNSSVPAFYFRQAGHSKGAQGINEGHKAEVWEQFMEYSGGLVGSLPSCPKTGELASLARRIEELAMRRARSRPAALVEHLAPSELTSSTLTANQDESQHLLARMCALQEELDWLVYEAFDLLSADDLALLRQTRGEALPGFPKQIDLSTAVVQRQGLYPGHRPFEIVLARDCLVNGTKTAWFARNAYASPSEVTSTYAPSYCRLLEARVTIIDRNPTIRLLEQPEYKRRWTKRDWNADLTDAGKDVLATLAEKAVEEAGRPTSLLAIVRMLAGDVRAQAVAQVALGWADPAPGVADVVAASAVPFLAAIRHTDSGLEKRALWEKTWDRQRCEDRGEKVETPVPPKYDQKDFRSGDVYRMRGPLDVPKERFISYPGCSPDDDPSPLYGWAGWDHLQRAQALVSIYRARQKEGWDAARLTPLLAGIAELVPWVLQWHDAEDPETGERAGASYQAFVAGQLRALQLTQEALAGWRPTAAKRAARQPAKAKEGAPAERSTQNGRGKRAPRGRRVEDKIPEPEGSTS